MNKMIKLFMALALTSILAACGTKVEIPPAHIGKLTTKDGYQDGVRATSKFRLPMCFSFCDKLILLDVSDKAVAENLSIFMPTDKLNMEVGLRTTLSLNPAKTEGLFSTLTPVAGDNDRIATIAWESIYKTYAQQVILTETREYISKYSIAQIASSMDKVNSDLRAILSEKLKSTPFNVSYVGVTNVKYPDIITKAQENAAERREQIQQEEARLEVSRVTLERELAEAQLQRQIEVEKAETEANRQRVIAQSVDPRVLQLRALENEQLWIEKWNGQPPETLVTGGSTPNMFLRAPGAK